MNEQPLSATVAGNVRAEVMRRRFQHGKLADSLGMSRSAFSQRYRGRIAWPLDELQLLADHLEVPLASLLGSKDEQPRPQTPTPAVSEVDVSRVEAALDGLAEDLSMARRRIADLRREVRALKS